MAEMKSPRARVMLRSTLAFLIGAAVGGFGAMLFARIAADRLPDFDPGAVGAIVIASGSIVVLFLVLAVHEAGHLLGGRLARFRAVLFIVGPLKLERRGDRWKLGFNPTLALYGGMAASVPSENRDLRRRMLRLVAGGPVTSLVAGAFGLLVWFGVSPASASADLVGSGVYLSIWLLVFSAGSLLIGLVTLAPGETSGFYTDGRRILRLLRGGPEVDGEVALMALVAQSRGGRRPREWNDALVEQALRLDVQTAMGASARQLAHEYALDRREIDEARQYLDEALTGRDALPQIGRASLYLQAAYFAAVHERDPHSARDWLRQAKGGAMISPHERTLAEAAVSHAEGRRSEAATLLERAGAELDKALDAGSARAAMDRIAELKDAIRAPAPAG